MSDTHRPLPEATARPYTHSRPLPPYRGILAVDAKDFTGHPAIEHGVLSRAVPELLETSFDRAGLPEVWRDRRFPASTGDGYVFGFDPAALPFVIHPWLRTLQDVLAEFNLHSLGTVRLRLRASVHVGPLPDTGDAYDGNGTPRNDTHRLLDSRPVKAMLAGSSEQITQVVAILSDRCYDDVVAGGYTGRHPDYFTEVTATVEGKHFGQRAWLYVPAPSGSLRAAGAPSEEGRSAPRDDGQQARGKRPAAHRTVNHRADNGNINTGTVHGDQRVHRVDVAGDQYDIAGDNVQGHKVGTVHGNLGDTVHGDKHGDKDGDRR